MENTENFLDWLVSMDVKHYKTDKTAEYTPSGNSHFYLEGSQMRFTSNDMIIIWSNKADSKLNKRWQNAIVENVQYKKQ